MQPNLSSSEVPAGGAPDLERLPKPINPEQMPPTNVESTPRLEKTPRPQGDSANQNAGMPPLPPVATAPVAQSPPVSAPVTPVTDDNPLVAEDSDLIEKEWVKKAKVVVEQTKEDPYVQNKQLNGVRVDYIKKRYNKEVKLAEESS